MKAVGLFKGLLSSLIQFLTTESSLKMMLFSFSRSLQFSRDFLVLYENGLIRKPRLVSKFLTSQVGQQIITIRILPNISRSKNNQAIKFGLLSKNNQAIKFGLLREYEIFFLKSHAENLARRPLFLF